MHSLNTHSNSESFNMLSMHGNTSSNLLCRLQGLKMRSLRIQTCFEKDAGVYLLQNYSTCFGCLSHPSSGLHQTVTAASDTGQSVRATTFRQRGLISLRIQTCFEKNAGVCLLQNYSTCFGCLSHPSSGLHQTVTAASDTGHIVRATTFHHRGLIRTR